jgi:DNA-binding NtrC family response regulator
VVDDSPFVLDAWAAQLASEAELHLLPSFESLMERMRSEPNYLNGIRCVIVDLYIDGSALNGLDMARMIKKIRPDLPVILSSDAIVKEGDLQGAIDRVIGKDPQSLGKLGLVA